MAQQEDLMIGTGRRFHTPTPAEPQQYFNAHNATGLGITSSASGDDYQAPADCDNEIAALEAALIECSNEKIELEEEITTLEEEIEALDDIMEGGCFPAQTVWLWDLNPNNPCAGSVTTSVGLMCYTGLNASNKHTFSLVITKSQVGGEPFSCGRSLSMKLRSTADPNVSYGGDGTQTITVTNNLSQEWTVEYSNDQVFVGAKTIGSIYLPSGGGAAIFRPLNSSTNIV